MNHYSLAILIGDLVVDFLLEKNIIVVNVRITNLTIKTNHG